LLGIVSDLKALVNSMPLAHGSSVWAAGIAVYWHVHADLLTHELRVSFRIPPDIPNYLV